MKVKCIIVDEVPERCEDCLLYNRPYTEDDSKCDLDYINHAVCLLIRRRIIMKRLFRFFRKHDFEYAGKCRVALLS